MKKFVLVTIFIAASFYTVGSYAEMEKPEWAPDMSAGIAFETKYIWRGQNMVDDPVLQPEVYISKYGLSFYYWGNFSTASSQKRWTEHDYTVDYTFNMGQAKKLFGIKEDKYRYIDGLSFSLGNIFYIFPEYSQDQFHTEEFYVGVSYDCILQPRFTWYIDYDQGAGSYLAFGIGHVFDLKNGVNAKTGITFGYNAGQWGYGYKFAPMLFSGEVNVPLFKYFTVTPNIYYSLALDRETENDLAYNSEFYGGIKVLVSF